MGWPVALASQALDYLVAQREVIVDDFHGTRVADPYRWLEKTESPRAIGWLKAEKTLTARYLGGLDSREGRPSASKSPRRRATSLVGTLRPGR